MGERQAHGSGDLARTLLQNDPIGAYRPNAHDVHTFPAARL